MNIIYKELFYEPGCITAIITCCVVTDPELGLCSVLGHTCTFSNIFSNKKAFLFRGRLLVYILLHTKVYTPSSFEQIFFVPFVCFIICFIADAKVVMKYYYAKKDLLVIVSIYSYTSFLWPIAITFTVSTLS